MKSDNNNNLKNQNTVGEDSNNFINEQNVQNNDGNATDKSKAKKAKKLSAKESALKDIEKLQAQKKDDNENEGANSSTDKSQQAEKDSTQQTKRKQAKQSEQLPVFKTKKELNKQVNKEVRRNKRISKEDVLDRQERQLRAHLNKIEKQEQQRREELEQQKATAPKIVPTTASLAGKVEDGDGAKTEKTSTSSIKSLDDLILATQVSKKKSAAKKKTHEDYVAELKSKSESEEADSREKGENFLHEKQSILEQLKRINEVREELPVEEEEKRKRRGLFWWFILLALLGVVVVMGYLVMDVFRPTIPDYISIDVSMLNPEGVFNEVVTNEPIKIQPGDTFPLKIKLTNNSTEGKNLYVRFMVVLEVTRVDDVPIDYPEYINVYSDKEIWHRFNEEEEKTFEYGVSSDDYYNYYVGELETDETIELTEEIGFDLWAISNSDEQELQLAGQQLHIKVLVEAIEYFDPDPKSPSHWEDAPRAWINKIIDFKNQQEKETD